MRKEIKEYYCDRCGIRIKGEFPPLFYTKMDRRRDMRIRAKNCKAGLFRLMALGREWYDTDLCDNCKKEFKDWWENYKR